jgi:hypothetical protein
LRSFFFLGVAFPLTIYRSRGTLVGWLPRLALSPRRGRLQFVNDAPAVQVGDAKPEIDTQRIAQLADAISAFRKQMSGARENG